MKHRAFLLVFALLLVLLSCGSVSAVLDDAIRYYSIDDADRTGNSIDDLTGNSNATNTNMVLGVTGIINEGVEGSGASGNYHISYTSTAEASWSISLWFKADGTGDAFWASSTVQEQYLQVTDDTTLQLYIGSGNSVTVPSLGTSWHHFVISIDTCTAKIYLDGVNVDNHSYSSDCSLVANTYYLGDWRVDSLEWDGKLDEFGLWNRILTSSEASELYNSGNAYNPYATPPPSNAPTVTAHTTSPSIIYTNTDFKFNMTATDNNNATINAYVQFYINGTSSGATQSQAIANNTNTLIGTLSNSNFGTGAELIAEYWASDGINSTAKANQSTVTVQPPAFEISINSPADDAQTNNNTPGFSFTVSGSPDTYSCSLFLNDSSYGTNATTQDSIATIIVASTIPDNIYNWYVNCTSDVTTNQSEIRTIRIDTEAPAINDNFINNSAYLQDNITGQFNFTDNILLHSLNISIDGSEIYTNESIDTAFFQYNLSVNPSTLSNGVHELFIRIADGHTAIQLKSPDAYNPSNGIFNNYVKYSIRKPYPALDITMYLKDQSVFDSWDITKKNDRYTETVRPYSKLTTQTFIVESDQYIHIVNDPKGNYKGQWLIIGDHWKDFVLHGEENSKVSIKKITDNKVEVIISEIKNTEELTFESTGDLNIVTKTYNFYVSNSSVNASPYTFETDYQTITFFLNKTGDVTTNATLYWNGTLKSSSKNSYDDYDKYTATFKTAFMTDKEENITSSWDYNITDGSTESGNITFNQTIYRMSIDTCSEYTARAINFTLMDESTNELLPVNGEIHAAMHLSRSNSSDYRTTNLDYSGANQYGLCIYPSWANYTIDFAFFEYLAEDYAVKEYSTAPFEINNETEEIKLYLTQTSLSSNVIISLKDEDDNALEGYNVRSKRYYPETGEEVTVEISRTDYNGQAIAHLILYSVYYSFSIEELDGTVLKIISASKIYSEHLTFVLDIDGEEENFEDKVWYSISPDSPVQSQAVNFSLITVSPGNYIEWFAIETRFNSTDYLDNSTNAGGGTVSIELDLTNQTGWLSITYYIQAANETLLTFDRGYFVTDIVPGDHSIEGQRSSWETIFDVMWRVVAAVLISIIAVLLLVPFIGPESAGIVGVLTQIGFTIMGWIPLWMIILEAVILIGLYLMSNRGQV